MDGRVLRQPQSTLGRLRGHQLSLCKDEVHLPHKTLGLVRRLVGGNRSMGGRVFCLPQMTLGRLIGLQLSWLEGEAHLPHKTWDRVRRVVRSNHLQTHKNDVKLMSVNHHAG